MITWFQSDDVNDFDIIFLLDVSQACFLSKIDFHILKSYIEDLSTHMSPPCLVHIYLLATPTEINKMNSEELKESFYSQVLSQIKCHSKVVKLIDIQISCVTALQVFKSLANYKYSTQSIIAHKNLIFFWRLLRFKYQIIFPGRFIQNPDLFALESKSRLLEYTAVFMLITDILLWFGIIAFSVMCLAYGLACLIKFELSNALFGVITAAAMYGLMLIGCEFMWSRTIRKYFR